MDNRYLQVARRVEQCIQEWGAPTPQAEERVINQIIHAPWTINFDEVANTYNSLFWVRNFWKTAYFFSYDYSLTQLAKDRLARGQHLQALFVGGGAGADVLAMMTWFAMSFPLAKLTITVLDDSQAQLDRLALFIERTKDLLSGAEIVVRSVQMYAEQWQPEQDSVDVLVLGHFLTENRESVHTVLQKSNDAVRAGGDVIVIERPNDVVLDHAKHVLAGSALTVIDTTTDPERIAPILKQIAKPGNSGLTAHYLRATQPNKKRSAEIVSSYFQAWRHQAIEPLYDIFSTSAVYDRQPGRVAPVRGIEEMVAYWRERPMRQSDIKILVRNVAYTENTAVCAFEADFDTSDAHEIVRGAISFDIDAYTNKIRRMTGSYGINRTLL